MSMFSDYFVFSVRDCEQRVQGEADTRLVRAIKRY